MHIEERTLDVSKKDGRSGQIKPVILRKGEQNQTQIKINLTSDGEPYSIGNLTPKFCAVLPNKKYVRDTSHVTKSTNYVTYTVQSDLTSADGDIRVAYIELQSSGNSLTSDTLPIIVLENTDLTTEQAQQYQDQIEALVKDLENSINKANNAASNASSAATSANNAASSANTAKTNAQNAANSANTAANEANTAKNNADKATSAANTAAEAANTAKQAVDDAMGKFTTITDSEVKYQVGTSGTTPPTGTWLTEPPTVPQGQYLWVRNTTSYNKGNPTVAYAVAFQGRDGSFAGDERIEALEEKVDSINDITTMPNLLLGTQDFANATSFESYNSGVPSNGWYMPSGYMQYFKITTDKDGFAIATIKKETTAPSDITYRSNAISCEEVEQEFTISFRYKVDEHWKSASTTICILQEFDGVSQNPLFSTGFKPDEEVEVDKWYEKTIHYKFKGGEKHTFILILVLHQTGTISFTKPLVYKGYIEKPEWNASPFDYASIEVESASPQYLGLLPVSQMIDTKSDLNDYTNPGTYYSPSVLDASSIINTPYPAAAQIPAFKLYVEYATGNPNSTRYTYIRQRFVAYWQDATEWIRQRDTVDGSWTPWRQTYANTTVRPVEGGGTGGNSIHTARTNLRIDNSLETNPISSIDNDLRETWKTKTPGMYIFNVLAMHGQPSQYGMLFNYVNGNDIAQAFITNSDAVNKEKPLLGIRRVNGSNASMGDFQEIYSQTYSPYTPGLYPGQNLATKFAVEIGSTPLSTWLSNRVKAGNFDGINIYDWIDIPVDGTSRRYRIGDIDPWYLCADQPIGHHIVMIPDQHWILSEEKDGDYAVGSTKSRVAWNTTNDNNGTASENHPYLGSNLHKWEIEKMLPRFPKEWQDVMLDRRALVEERYGSSGKIQDSNNWSWANLGKLWSLSETEIYGHSIWGTKGFSEGIDCQLAIFKRSKARRLSTSFWLRNPTSGFTNNVCYAVAYGYGYYTSASTDWVAPRPCFLVG